MYITGLFSVVICVWQGDRSPKQNLLTTGASSCTFRCHFCHQTNEVKANDEETIDWLHPFLIN